MPKKQYQSKLHKKQHFSKKITLQKEAFFDRNLFKNFLTVFTKTFFLKQD